MTESQRVGGGLNSVLFFNFSREDLGRSAALNAYVAMEVSIFRI